MYTCAVLAAALPLLRAGGSSRMPIQCADGKEEACEDRAAATSGATGFTLLERSHRISKRNLAAAPSKTPAPKHGIALSGHDGSPFHSVLGCGVSARVVSSRSKDQTCPRKCPLWGRRPDNYLDCTFECVPASTSACMALNPFEPIPDKHEGICRPCGLPGCTECSKDARDYCAECLIGYKFVSGRCISHAKIVKGIIIVFVVLVFISALVWVVRLCFLEDVNPVVLKHALEQRSRAKLHMPKEKEVELSMHSFPSLRSALSMYSIPSLRSVPSSTRSARAPHMTTFEGLGLPVHNPHSSRHLWPLTTNLLNTSVAGPGVVLHFNFQFNVITWAFVVLTTWVLFSLIFEPDFLSWARPKAKTPRQTCIMVAWDYEMVRNVLVPKVCFVSFLYLLSFFSAIVHSVRQLKSFQRLSRQMPTHKVFCAKCTGLPNISGKAYIEQELKFAVEYATEQTVIGVSVTWDVSDCESILMDTIKRDTYRREEKLALAQEAAASSSDAQHDALPLANTTSPRVPDYSALRAVCENKTLLSRASTQPQLEASPSGEQRLGWLEHGYLSPTVQRLMTKGRRGRRKHIVHVHTATKDTDVDIVDLLTHLETCDHAFVVFDSESARDEAIATAQRNGGVDFRGAKLQLHEPACEPDSIIWGNFHLSSKVARAVHTCLAIGAVALALVIWACVFYIPYAYFTLTSNYQRGQEPDAITGYGFSMIVVVGNCLMYFVCSDVSDRIGFRSVDSREKCYMLLYFFAVMSNVVLDLFVTYVVAGKIMVHSQGDGGQRSQGPDVHTERFEAFAYQAVLSDQHLAYCFPATFLIPFLLEPIFTIYAPYKIVQLIVRSSKEVKAIHAEGYLESTQLDLSRYADISINLTLAIFVFFFVSGQVVYLFGGLVISHVYIYCYDHYRVLRSIPACDFASFDVDWWAQWMLTLPCGVLLSCVAYKATQASCSEYYHCVNFNVKVALCLGLFLLHVVVHTLILLYVVPRFGLQEIPPNKETYKECARRIARSWFNSNPVQCLRSEYLYEHSPPVRYCMVGKEHLLEVNEEIGLYFEDTPAHAEDYSKAVEAQDLNDVKAEILKETSALGMELRRCSTAAKTSGSEVINTISRWVSASSSSPMGRSRLCDEDCRTSSCSSQVAQNSQLERVQPVGSQSATT
mmetsp:Transcript_42834/g.118397  ORF Transcript_42834/g.118397 Transcript_42834/m.118397 type:complete len:1152 (+) Transcript_42834:168-3623(+)